MNWFKRFRTTRRIAPANYEVTDAQPPRSMRPILSRAMRPMPSLSQQYRSMRSMNSTVSNRRQRSRQPILVDSDTQFAQAVPVNNDELSNIDQLPQAAPVNNNSDLVILAEEIELQQTTIDDCAFEFLNNIWRNKETGLKLFRPNERLHKQRLKVLTLFRNLYRFKDRPYHKLIDNIMHYVLYGIEEDEHHNHREYGVRTRFGNKLNPAGLLYLFPLQLVTSSTTFGVRKTIEFFKTRKQLISSLEKLSNYLLDNNICTHQEHGKLNDCLQTVEEEDDQNRERLGVGGSVKTKRKSHRIKKSKGGNGCKTRKH